MKSNALAECIHKTFIYGVLFVFSFLFLFPLAWMISTSLKSLPEALRDPPQWLPCAEAPSATLRKTILDEIHGMGDSSRTTWIESMSSDPIRLVETLQNARDPRVADIRNRLSESTRRAIDDYDHNAWKWRNYLKATKAIPFWKYAGNTLYLAILNVLGTVLSSAMAAYGFSCIRWRGRDGLFALSLATLMVPFPVLMVPTYAIFRGLGWIGSFQPLWIPAFLGSAYNIFLLRQFFFTIPRDLMEAAEIDGCGRLRIFAQIILPLARPSLMVVGLFCFMYIWNDFMGPLIYLTKPDQFTLTLGLQRFQSQQGGTDINLLMAASTLVILPVIVLFLAAQRTFIQGISMTGLKG